MTLKDMKQYLDLAKRILTDEETSYVHNNRTGMGTLTSFGPQIRFDLREGFPLMTTKRVGYKTVLNELSWFLSGSSNLKPLLDRNVHIWDDNAFAFYLKNQGINGEPKPYSTEWFKAKNEFIERVRADASFAQLHGEMGRIYGPQWRHWKKPDETEVDQIQQLIDGVKADPTSRRHIVNAWNPGEINDSALPPCHALYQFNVQDGYLDLTMFQRSADIFLGVPFNIASSCSLMLMLAQETGLKPRNFIHNMGNAHLYCSTEERAQFHRKNLPRMKNKIREARSPADYASILAEINASAPTERIADRVIEKPEDSFDHVTAILEQLARDPRPLPRVDLQPKPFWEVQPEDFTLTDYDPHPSIKRSMAA
jgi:thymidylate synthase